MVKNIGEFEIEMVMIGALKNYIFRWVDRSLC